MMTFNEFILIDGVFEHIHALKPDLPFLGDGQNEVMDRLLMLNYGDQLVYRKLIPFTANQICEMVVKQHSHKWEKLVSIDESNLSSGKRILTETTTTNENRNNSRDNKNLISAYNDDSLIVNDGSLSTDSDDLTGSKIRTLTDENQSLKSAYYNLSLSDKNNIINIVLKDVASFITLSIY